MVEGAALEKQYAGNRIEGSNPSLSARRGVVIPKGMAISLLEEKDSNLRFVSELCAQKLASSTERSDLAVRHPSLSAMDSTSSPLGGLFEFIMGGVRTHRVRCSKGAGK